MPMHPATLWFLVGAASCLPQSLADGGPGPASCPSAAAQPSVRSEGFRTAAARFERFWSLEDYQRLRAGGGGETSGQPLGFRHVLFVVKASQARAHMAIRMEQVWLRATSNRLFLVDELIEGLPENLQVVMNGGGGASTGRADPVATSRLLIWLYQARAGYDTGGLSEDTRWVVLLGDDVFVNLARLYYFLALYPAEDHPVMFAHVLSDADVYDFDMPCLDSGAAILNMRAVELIGRFASCRECPYVGLDGISLSFCAFFSGVPLVHVPAMHCHAPHVGDGDRLLTGDMLAHHWIAAGGLSVSTLGTSAAEGSERLAYHPFEADFPNLACRLPQGPRWTAQELWEKALLCSRARGDVPGGLQAEPSLPLDDGDELSSGSFDEGADSAPASGWPPAQLEDVLYGESARDGQGACRSLASSVAAGLADDDGDGARPARWRFLRPAGTWLNRAQVGSFLATLHASGVLELQGGLSLLFAFVNPATSALEPDGGLLLSASAARLLVARQAGGVAWPPSLDALAALGITVVHAPQLVPDAAALPRGLRGAVCAGAASGSWSVGRLRDDDAMDELEALVRERSFFMRMVSENFADWAGSAPDCENASVFAEARSWMRFLHDDDEHIKAVRGFQGGRREFRTLHAMYRSENGYVLPLHGISPDTVLVARDCPEPS